MHPALRGASGRACTDRLGGATVATVRAVLLRLEGVARSFGARVLFRGVDLHVAPGDRIGLIGRNGAGKTTLLRVAAGREGADEGRVLAARGVRVGLLRQEIDPATGHTVREEASLAPQHLARLEREIDAPEPE